MQMQIKHHLFMHILLLHFQLCDHLEYHFVCTADINVGGLNITKNS